MPPLKNCCELPIHSPRELQLRTFIVLHIARILKDKSNYLYAVRYQCEVYTSELASTLLEQQLDNLLVAHK